MCSSLLQGGPGGEPPQPWHRAGPPLAAVLPGKVLPLSRFNQTFLVV